MFSKIILLATVAIGSVFCEPPVPQYGVPFNTGGSGGGGGGGYSGGYNNGGHGVNGNAPSNNYGAPSHDNNDHHGYGEPKAYEFGYQVKDDYTGTNYNRQEQSDGNQVTGSYRVALPDGRTQIVTYYADWKSGFHADVRYEGEAQFPDQYNNNNHNNNNGYANNGYQNNNGGYPASNNGYSHHNVPSTQYGGPVNPVAINNQYAAPSTGYGAPNSATSSVSIKDYSSPGTAYNTGNNYDYDSYASGYDNKQKPSTGYGAP